MTTLYEIIDFRGKKDFLKAQIDAMVYVATKKTPNEYHKIYYNQPKVLDVPATYDKGGFFYPQKNLTGGVWNFVPPILQNMLSFIKNKTKPLQKWGFEVYRGVTTGYNKAFVINTEKKVAIEKQDPCSKKIIHPVLKGKDVSPFSFIWRDNWLIFSKHGIEIDNFPGAKMYLSQYKEKLIPKPEDWKSSQKSSSKWQGR